MKILVSACLLMLPMLVQASPDLYGDSLDGYKYKLGLKASGERASWLGLSPASHQVYNGGFQFVGNFNGSDASLESGLYLTNKVIDDGQNKISYRFVNLPLDLRFDTHDFYLAGGLFTDYMIAVKGGRLTNTPLDKNRSAAFGFNAALGFEKSLAGPWSLALEGRYYRSFFEIPDRLVYVSYGLALGINYKISR